MPIPLHTFAPTGDPVVDNKVYFNIEGRPHVDSDEWFARNSLVLSHLPSKIIRESVDFDLFGEGRPPDESGIYFLIHYGRIVYVGKARSIYARLKSHLLSKEFSKYWCFGGIPYDWLGDAEGYYIDVCKPIFNVARVAYSQELNKISKMHRAEWEAKEAMEASGWYPSNLTECV